MPTYRRFDPLAHNTRGIYTYLNVDVEQAPDIMQVGKFYELVFDPSGPKPQPYLFKVLRIEKSLQPDKVKYVGIGRFHKSVIQTVATMNELKGEH